MLHWGSLGLKYLPAIFAKVPVLVVVGKREAEEQSVSIRRLGQKQQSIMSLDEACVALASEAVPPDLQRKKAIETEFTAIA